MIELYYPSEDIPQVPSPKAFDAAQRANGGKRDNDEQFPVVDTNGVVIGRSTRTYCHGGSFLLHPVVHLHIIDREGNIFLQQRAMAKKIQPGKWDTAVGGHVSFGESTVDALYREAMEELGLTRFTPIGIDSYVYESEVERELVCVFACVGHYDDLRINPEELMGGRYWSQQEIRRAYGRGILTPNFESEYMDIRARLNSLL